MSGLLGLLWAVVAGLTAVTLVGFASAAHWALAWLDAPRAHYALTLLVLALLAALLGRWVAVVVAVLAAAVNLALVVPLWFGSAPDLEPDTPTLDVVFFNTKIRSDADALADWLAAEQPDVAILAATTDRWAQVMGERSGMRVALSRPRGTDLELLVLTAGAPVDVGVLDWNSGSGRDHGVEAVMELNGQPVRILGIHPVSPVGRQRMERRDVLLARAAGWVAASDNPSVIAGDLNAVPWSPALRRLQEQAGLVDSLEGFGVQPSWPDPIAWAGVPLDHVLHTPDLVTVHRELGPSFGSDHRLIRARLALAD